MPAWGIDRITAIGRQLLAVHDVLRADIEALHEALDHSADTPPAVAAHLRVQCLAFCTALADHHTGEDAGIFPALLTERPDLRPVIDDLVRDHEFVASILVELKAIAERWTTDDDVGAARRELDGLMAVLENHFRYEERKLVSMLDALDPPADADELEAMTRALALAREE